MKRAEAYSHERFDEICQTNGWDDTNVETLTDKAFISITCTFDVKQHYLNETDEHWFKLNHPNVLNIEFDDVKHDVIWDDYKACVITDEQAEQIVNFIEDNLGKEFYIHCRAGVSRSGAVCHFIHTNYYKEDEESGHIRPNIEVLRKLNHVLWERHFKKDEEN